MRDGKLDFALTKPEDAQLIVSLRDAAALAARRGVSGCVIVIGVGRRADRARASASGTRSRSSRCCWSARSLLYCFWLILATGAFWIVNMWFLAELFEGIYQDGRWPIGVYPGWLRYSMTYLVPIGFAVTVPAQALTARLHWHDRRDRARLRRSCSSRSRAGSGASGCRRYSGASA